MILLRPYQQAAVEHVAARWRAQVRRIVLVAATGSGKTILAARFILGAAAKGKRALFLVHRREIIAQAWGKIVEAGVSEDDCGVIMGDGRITHPVTRELFDARRPGARVQVASTQTLIARVTRDEAGAIVARSWPAADLVFVDECHHASSRTWSEILAHYREAGATIIGLTATPERADGRGLDEHFDELHLVATPAELMAAGYLVRPRIFTSERAPDLKGVSVRGGDYAPGELARACDRPQLVGDVVAHYQRHGQGQRAVVFAAGVEHSRHFAEAFRAAGIDAEHLDGKTPNDERDAILTRLREGTTRVVCNVGVLTEGWDEPLVGCVILARPTKSVGLYLQMAGRGLRPAEGKVAVLLDHAGCVAAHGAPQDPREWSLAGRSKRAGASGGASPLKRCPACGRMVERTEPACPECGREWPAAECRPLEQVEGELREVSEAELEARAVERQRKAVNRLLGRHVGALCSAGVASADAWTRVNRAVYALRRKSRTKMTAAELASLAADLGAPGALERLVPVPALVPEVLAPEGDEAPEPVEAVFTAVRLAELALAHRARELAPPARVEAPAEPEEAVAWTL